LFRIDRNLVNLSARQYITVEKKAEEAGAVGETPDAAASAAELIRAEAHAEAEARAKNILSEAEAKAKAKAKKIVDDARDEAAALIVAAREQVEVDRRAAWQEGFTEGSEEGKRSFDKQLSDKMREDDGKLERVIEELYNERTNTYDRLEDDMVDLAIQIVRKILDPAEEEFGEYFRAMIVSALRQLNPDGKIVIRVSSSDYERFFPTGGAAFEMDSGVTVTASVIKDERLGEGGCVIDTEDATINAGLDSQLQYIELAFNQAEDK